MPGPVLLVHDDVSVIAPAKRVLQREGIDTLLVTNAVDAITAFDDLAPEVVVLAPTVDGGRGAEVLDAIRAHPRGPAVRIVLLGSSELSEPRATIVPLPLDGKALLEAVDHALRPTHADAAAAPESPVVDLASPLVLEWFDALDAPDVPGLSRMPAPSAERGGAASPAPEVDFEIAEESGRAAFAAAPGEKTEQDLPAARDDASLSGQAAALERRLNGEIAERESAAPPADDRAAELKRLQAERERLRAAQAEMDAELRRAAEERDVLRAMVDEAQARREQEETKLEDARRQAAEAAAGLARLERAVAEDSARANAERERAEAARAALEQARAAAVADAQRADEERRKLEAEVAQLEAQRREIRASMEQARARAEEERRARAVAPPPVPSPAAVATPIAAPIAAPPPRTFSEPRLAPVRPELPAEVPAAPERRSVARRAEPAQPVAPSLAVPSEGTLAALDAPTLLCRIFAARATGRLDVEGDGARRTLWFEAGRLVAADSSLFVETLEDVALRLGLIGTAQHHALRAGEERHARRLAVRMVELGYIRPGEMVGLVRRRVQEIAWALFLDDRGAYRFTGEVAPADARVVLPMHPFGLVLEGVRRKFSLDRLHARLGGPATLLRPGAARIELDAFGMSPEERALVERVDGLQTVEELLFEGVLEEQAALQALYAAIAAGALEIAALGQAPRARSAREELELDLARIAEKHAHAVGGDYFQILGLARNASAYEVREARERLAREFDAARFAAVDDPVVQERLRDIGQALAEAAEVLADDGIRAQYARQLVD